MEKTSRKLFGLIIYATEHKIDKIITIQYQELERNSGKAKGNLIILKEWESSEKDILQRFLNESGIMGDYDFDFISVGFNLNFEHKFFKERTTQNNLPSLDILNKPFIDLRALGILMNKGEFKGSGLDKISGKPSNGMMLPEWYKNKEYDKITGYIEAEAREFIKLNAWLYEQLPKLREQFASTLK